MDQIGYPETSTDPILIDQGGRIGYPETSTDPILMDQGGRIGYPETSITRHRYTLHNVAGERKFSFIRRQDPEITQDGRTLCHTDILFSSFEATVFKSLTAVARRIGVV